jgi:hypothetical protein
LNFKIRRLTDSNKNVAKAMENTNILNPSAKADGNKLPTEKELLFKLPPFKRGKLFTLVNEFVEYRKFRGFNPILK